MQHTPLPRVDCGGPARFFQGIGCTRAAINVQPAKGDIIACIGAAAERMTRSVLIEGRR